MVLRVKSLRNVVLEKCVKKVKYMLRIEKLKVYVFECAFCGLVDILVDREVVILVFVVSFLDIFI